MKQSVYGNVCLSWALSDNYAIIHHQFTSMLTSSGFAPFILISMIVSPEVPAEIMEADSTIVVQTSSRTHFTISILDDLKWQRWSV